MIEHNAPISGIASYGNKWVATAGYDNKIILWDVKHTQSLAVGYHDHLVNKCAFDINGNYLATGSSDHTARIWSLPNLKLLAVCYQHQDDVEEVAFHPRQPLLVTASRDHSLRIFDFNGKLTHQFNGHQADVLSVTWTNNGNQIISSSDDGTIKYWDVGTGQLIKSIDFNDVETDTITLSPSGIIYAGNDNGEIVTLNNEINSALQCHKSGIKKLTYSAKTKKLLSLSYDRCCKFWNTSDVGKLTLIHEEQLPNIIWPRAGEFLNDDTVVFSTFGSSYALFNLTTRAWSLEHVKDTFGINAVTIFNRQHITVGDAGRVYANNKLIAELGSLCNFIIPFANTLIAGGQLGKVFNICTGQVIYEHHSPLNCATSFAHNNNEYLAIGSYTGEALIFKIDNKKNIILVNVLHVHTNAIKGLAASSNELFSVSANKEVAWYSIEDFSCTSRLASAHKQIINACVNINVSTFASVGRDCILTIWRDRRAYQYQTEHTHSIKCLAIDDRRTNIAMGSYSGDVIIYNILQEKTIHHVRPTSAGISSIIFDRETNSFLASSYDGQLYRIEA